jgi:transposase-like protein
MIQFSTINLMDEDKCYAFLVEILHPDGMKCPKCGHPTEDCPVHRRDRAPVLYYRCKCGRVYNAFNDTMFQGTHYACSEIVRMMQGFSQGVTTSHLARELKRDRTNLIEWRKKFQANAFRSLPRDPLNDDVVEADEMYQNAGEKRCSAS